MPKAEVIQMHEKVERPDALVGATYKIKSPLFEHALYVTINDIVLNEGTEYELRRPFEIFINSKNMDHFQWIVALTPHHVGRVPQGRRRHLPRRGTQSRVRSARRLLQAGGVYMPSIVAELGAIIEQHLKMIGLLVDPEMSNEQRKLINEKRAAMKRAWPPAQKKKYEISRKPSADPNVEISDDLAGALGENNRREPEEESSEESASAFRLARPCATSAIRTRPS